MKTAPHATSGPKRSPCLHGSQNVLAGTEILAPLFSWCPQCVIVSQPLVLLEGWVGFILLDFKTKFFLPAPVKSR